MKHTVGLILLAATIVGCTRSVPVSHAQTEKQTPPPKPNPVKVAHVIVALCDNVHQGIVKVPARIGNGDDLVDNLYWGASLGVKSYFRQSTAWKLASTTKPSKGDILERAVFVHKATGAVLVADAYRGAAIKKATVDYFDFLSGRRAAPLRVGNREVSLGGGADLVAYVGHDGLMEWSIPAPTPAAHKHRPLAVALACKTQQFFGADLKATGAKSYVLTQSLMAPEAYNLEAVLGSWVKGEDAHHAVEAAARAYAKYQKISVKAARTVFTAK